jgi:hypothetical protein
MLRLNARKENQMNMRYYDKVPFKYFDLFAKLWPVAVSIIVLILAIAYKNNEIEAHERALSKNTIDHNVIDNRLTVDEQRIVRIETTLDILPEMRSDIKTLLRRSK